MSSNDAAPDAQVPDAGSVASQRPSLVSRLPGGAVAARLVARVNRDDAALVASAALSLLAFALLRAPFWAAATLSPAMLESPSSILALVRSPARLAVVLVPTLVLLGLRSGLTWTGIESGRRLRVFVMAIVTVAAWTAAGSAYDPFFGEARVVDRLLVMVLAAGSVLSPLAVPALALVALAMTLQRAVPLGVDSTDWRLVFDALLLFACWTWTGVGRRRRAAHFVFLALCLLAVNYGWQGVYKLRLGPALSWIRDNDLSRLALVAHARGWLPQVGEATMDQLAHVVRRCQVPLATAVVVFELGAFLLFASRRLACVLLVALAALHAGIFVLSGICFWKWVVLDLALAVVLLRWPRTELAPLFLPRIAGPTCGLVAALALAGVFRPPTLAWYDSGLDEAYELEAVLLDGRVLRVLPAAMAPRDVAFAQARFYAVDPGWHVAGTYGGVSSHELASDIIGAREPADMRAVVARWGRSALRPRAVEQFDVFVRRFFGNLARDGPRLSWLDALGPPAHIRVGSALPTWSRDQPVARVRLWRVVRVVEGTRVRLLERVLVRDVDVAAVEH